MNKVYTLFLAIKINIVKYKYLPMNKLKKMSRPYTFSIKGVVYGYSGIEITIIQGPS